MFRIKAEYSEQLELNISLDRAREFFGELKNFVDLMPGIENIKSEASGVARWIVRTDVPVIGCMRANFAVELTEDSPDRIEWSPASGEKKNYLRYAASFVERSATSTLSHTAASEMRRAQARRHLLAGGRQNQIKQRMQSASPK